MPKDKVKVSPLPSPSKVTDKVSLLGGGLKGPSEPPRLFPGDLISFRADKPYEWLPWFGVVLSPNNAMARYMDGGRPNDVTVDKSRTLTTTSEDPSAVTKASEDPSAVTEASEDGEALASDAEPVALSVQPPAADIPENGIPDPVYVNWAHSQRIAVLRDRKDIAVVDRCLLKGTRVKNADGIAGTVVDRTEKVTLQVISTNHVIDNVDSRQLSPVAVYFRGREIQYNGWIGVVTAVRRLVTCRLENSGAHFFLKTNETDGFMKPDPYWGVGMPCAGLPAKFSPATMKKAVFNGTFMRFVHRWVRPVSYFYNRSAAKTVGVETTALDVMWVERCPNDPEASEAPPPTTLQKAEILNVKPLGLPNYETLGLNSVRMYGIKRNDALMSYSNWYAGFQAKFFGRPETSYARLTPAPSTLTDILANGYQIPVKVIFRQTEVEVEWDNGVSEHLLASRIPTILKSPFSTDFDTGFVVEPNASEEDRESKYGVVLCRGVSDSNTVKVRWIQPDGETLEDEVENDIGSVKESVLDLKVHPTVSTYSRGTTVFLKDHPQGYTAGTIIGIDFRTGKVLVVVPEVVEPIPVHAHKMTPLSKRTFWNFAERKWTQEAVVLPSGKASKATVAQSGPIEEANLVQNLIDFEQVPAQSDADSEQIQKLPEAIEGPSGTEPDEAENEEVPVQAESVPNQISSAEIAAENKMETETEPLALSDAAEDGTEPKSEAEPTTAEDKVDLAALAENVALTALAQETGSEHSDDTPTEFNLLGEFGESDPGTELVSEDGTPQSAPSDTTLVTEEVTKEDEVAKEGQIIKVD